MKNDVRCIVESVLENEKRMQKLGQLNGAFEKRRKAEAFVIAECAKQKVKLDRNDIVEAVVKIATSA